MSETTPDLGTAWRLLDEARAERDKLAAELEAVHTALGWADHQRAGWRFHAGLPMTWELSQVTMIGVRCDAAADIAEVAAERDRLRQALILMADDGNDEARDHLDHLGLMPPAIVTADRCGDEYSATWPTGPSVGTLHRCILPAGHDPDMWHQAPIDAAMAEWSGDDPNWLQWQADGGDVRTAGGMRDEDA